ncbi:MAG TPA: acetyl-CoA carboxylase biotin carboxyl carrier protein [archaeon]|nr:acetyl-CoA carboxylase biotin carboxyl carrier protein [archaeon]
MDVRYLKQLIRLVERSEINELEIEDGGTKVKIVKSPRNLPAQTAANPAPQFLPAPAVLSAAPKEENPSGTAAETEKQEKKSRTNLIEVTAPMVGTFYRAPSPGAPPFVDLGDRVEVGQTLCILEAMKLMNELESDVPGIIREICVENAQPVEFGHRLFLIEPEGK